MRSTSTVLESLISFARTQAPNILWTPKMPQTDLLAIAASEFGREYALLEYVQGLTTIEGFKRIIGDTTLHTQLADVLDVSIDNITALISYDLDKFAEGYGETRIAAIKARGVLKLVFSTNDPVTISEGSAFSSSDNSILYNTIETIDSLTPELDGGDYVLYVMCEAENSGLDYNVAVDTRFYSQSDIPGLTSAIVLYNIDNGADKETDANFIVRIELSRQAHGVGSKAWLESLILADGRVYDIGIYSLLDKDDGYFDRSYGLDVWVHCSETRKLIKNEPVVPDSNGKYYFKLAPLVSQNVIQSSSGTLNITEKADTTYYNSVLDSNYLSSAVVGTTVSYYVDETIRDLQDIVEDADNWIFGGRSLLLIKKAQEITFNIECELFIAAGYDSVVVKESISNNLLKFFSGGTTEIGKEHDRRKINGDIDKSDVLSVILNSVGLDRVNTDTFKLERSDGKYGGVDPVTVDYFEYATLGDVTYTIGG